MSNIYKLSLSDNSFLILNASSKLVLFNREDYTISSTLTIEEYVDNSDRYKNYVMLDKIDNGLLPIEFKIEKFNNIENLPLNIRFKKIQDIKQGDRVLGPDGDFREVMDLHRGQDEMFEITTEEGVTHILNGDHMLHLVNKNNFKDRLDISVKGYLNMDNSFKNNYKLVKIID